MPADSSHQTVQAPEEARAGTAASSKEEPPASSDEAASEEAPSRLSRLASPPKGPLGVVAVGVIGLFLLVAFYTLYFASSFLLPVVIALLLNFLLSPAVRFLDRLGLPTPLSAAVVMLALLGTLALGLYYLSGPAAEWIEKAPESLREAEYKLRGVRESVEKVQEATKQVGSITGSEENSGAAVQVQRSSASDAILSQTTAVLAGTAAVFFLLYFLLASGDLFLRKFVRVLPLYRRKRIAVQIAHAIERDLSTYLFTYAIINTVLGSTVALGLYFLGMPNPILWGLMVAVLNFVPYLGPLVGVTVVGLVAFVSFEDATRALAAPALYFTINALEGNLITPLIMGRRLQLNPVAIFISLTFWGWLWGIAGALLAVPLLVATKIVCDNVATLAPVGEFIGR